MSALRYSRPGIAGTTLVDLGPSVGRRTFTRGMVYGGVMATSGKRSMTTGIPPSTTIVPREVQSVTVEKCGYMMPKLGEPCARRPGHAPDHKSAAGMEAIARRRWAS